MLHGFILKMLGIINQALVLLGGKIAFSVLLWATFVAEQSKELENGKMSGSEFHIPGEKVGEKPLILQLPKWAGGQQRSLQQQRIPKI